MAGDPQLTPEAAKQPEGPKQKQKPSSAVRVAVEVRKAASELAEFGLAIRSLGLASWTFGVAFAGAAIGLRFLNGVDMGTPEFMACFVFAGLLVVFGVGVYYLESRGYVRLVSDLAEKKDWTALANESGTNHTPSVNGEHSPAPALGGSPPAEGA